MFFSTETLGSDENNPTEVPKTMFGIVDLYPLAKAKDPLLSRSEVRLEAAKADKDIALSALLPRISGNGSSRHLWHEVFNYSQDVKGDYTGYSYGLGGAVSILNMPGLYQYTATDYGIESAEYNIKAVRQNLIIRLLDACLKYLKSKADVKLYKDEMARVEKVLQQSQAFYKAGTGDVIAVYEGKARIDSAAADLVRTEAQLGIARQELIRLTGLEIDDLADIPLNKAAGPQPPDMEWWLITMIQKNPSLLQAKKDLIQAEIGIKSAKAGHLPTLQGNAGYTVDKGSTFLPEVETRQWYAGVSLSVPIYSGGETSAKTRRAAAAESERRIMLYDMQTQAISRLKEAYYNLSYTQSLVESYQRRLESSELQMKAVEKGCDIGTRSAVDLLNAVQSYAVSVRDLTSARYDNVFKQFELKAAAGILTEEDLLPMDGKLDNSENSSQSAEKAML